MKPSRIPSGPLVDLGTGNLDPALSRWLDSVYWAIQSPSFRVHRNGTNQVGIVSGVTTKVQFNSIATSATSVGYNDWGWFDLVTNFRWQPKIAGIYTLGSELRFVAAGAGFTNSLVINHSAYGQVGKMQLAVPAGATNIPSLVAIAQAPMNGTSDYIEFLCSQDTGGNQDINGSAQVTAAWGSRNPGS